MDFLGCTRSSFDVIKIKWSPMTTNTKLCWIARIGNHIRTVSIMDINVNFWSILDFHYFSDFYESLVTYKSMLGLYR